MFETIPAGVIPFASTFLFVFAIMFSMLVYANIIKSRSACGIMGAVIAFFAATYQPLVTFMSSFLPIAAGGLVILFFIVFVRDVLFKEKAGRAADPIPAALGLAISLLVIGVIWPQITKAYGFVGVAAENIVYIIAIIAIIIIFWAAYKQWGSSSGGGSAASASKT